MSTSSSATLGIGALSQATGIPVGTIRTWERRYGFPTPTRTKGGHRLYPREAVERLLLVAQALNAGHRPRQVVPLDIGALRSLLDVVVPRQTRDPRPGPPWIDLVVRMDGDGLDHALRAELSRRGALRFATEVVTPFLTEVGDRWRSGEISVYQEHLVSQRIRDLLTSVWRPMSGSRGASIAVFAGLPGEKHLLVLHLAALLAAEAGWQVLFVGDDTPIDDIASLANSARARAVVLTTSVTADADAVRDDLSVLRRILNAHTSLIVGGFTAPSDIQDITRMPDLDTFAEWLARTQR